MAAGARAPPRRCRVSPPMVSGGGWSDGGTSCTREPRLSSPCQLPGLGSWWPFSRPGCRIAGSADSGVRPDALRRALGRCSARLLRERCRHRDSVGCERAIGGRSLSTGQPSLRLRSQHPMTASTSAARRRLRLVPDGAAAAASPPPVLRALGRGSSSSSASARASSSCIWIRRCRSATGIW